MGIALSLAQRAQRVGEVPVGALVVVDGKIVGVGHNRVICDHDSSSHAEIVAMRAASSYLQNYRLSDASLYVTMEPCIMCAGAMLNARVRRLVFAARDERFGAAGSRLNLLESPFMNHQCQVFSGIMESESRFLLRHFFQSKREQPSG